jgi:hypothetical protein
MGRTRGDVARRHLIDVEYGSFSASGANMANHAVAVVVLLVEWKVPRCAVICRVFVPQPDGASSRTQDKEKPYL